MSNYKIIREPDGTFTTFYVLQDGTENGSEKTFDDAVASLVLAARVVNGTKIRQADIDVGTRVKVAVAGVEWDRDKTAPKRRAKKRRRRS